MDGAKPLDLVNENVHHPRVTRTDLLEYLDQSPPGEMMDMSEATSVPYETIRRIKQRITKNPQLHTFESLCGYVEAKRRTE